nr:hypothetical protein [uncultured Cohaesibacter sp.]
MSIYAIEHLKGDKRREEYRTWKKWIDKALVIRKRYHNYVEDDDLFAFSEVTSVGNLLSAANMAGFIALTEYATPKRSKPDRRKKSWGRADLWISNSKRSWSFEFKQMQKTQFSSVVLASKLDKARGDARNISEDEADMRIGGLIASTFFCHKEERLRYNERCEQFALETDDVHQAWAIKAGNDDPATYLYFSVV